MATTTGAGLEGVVATQSEICYIDGELGILSYQGFDIHTLAENAGFEEVIYLLWHGRLPKQAELDDLKASLVKFRPIPPEVTEFLRSVPKGAPMDVLRTAVSMLGVYDPLASDNSIEASLEKAQRLMSQTATIVTTFHRLRSGEKVLEGDPALSLAANFLYTLTGKKPDDVMEHVFDVALILHERGDDGETLMMLAELAYYTYLDTGIMVQPVSIAIEDWLNPAAFPRPGFLRNVAREGIVL